MARKDPEPAARDPRASLGGYGRKGENRDDPAHGGSENGSPQAAREKWLSDVRDGDRNGHQVTGPTDQ